MLTDVRRTNAMLGTWRVHNSVRFGCDFITWAKYFFYTKLYQEIQISHLYRKKPTCISWAAIDKVFLNCFSKMELSKNPSLWIKNFINSSRTNDACMSHKTRPSQVQKFGAKPLSELTLANCKLDPWKHISVWYESKYNNLHSLKLIWKSYLQCGSYFLLASVCWTLRYSHQFKLMFIIHPLFSQ